MASAGESYAERSSDVHVPLTGESGVVEPRLKCLRTHAETAAFGPATSPKEGLITSADYVLLYVFSIQEALEICDVGNGCFMFQVLFSSHRPGFD